MCRTAVLAVAVVAAVGARHDDANCAKAGECCVHCVRLRHFAVRRRTRRVKEKETEGRSSG